MNHPKVNKTFDCIAFKREAQARIYEQTKNMTSKEEIEYFEQRAEQGPLGEWWKRIKKRQMNP